MMDEQVVVADAEPATALADAEASADGAETTTAALADAEAGLPLIPLSGTGRTTFALALPSGRATCTLDGVHVDDERLAAAADQQELVRVGITLPPAPGRSRRIRIRGVCVSGNAVARILRAEAGA
jgi:hypothetical protein